MCCWAMNRALACRLSSKMIEKERKTHANSLNGTFLFSSMDGCICSHIFLGSLISSNWMWCVRDSRMAISTKWLQFQFSSNSSRCVCLPFFINSRSLFAIWSEKAFTELFNNGMNHPSSTNIFPIRLGPSLGEIVEMHFANKHAKIMEQNKINSRMR